MTGPEFKAHRLACNLSLQQCATILGVAKSTPARWESEVHPVTEEHGILIAQLGRQTALQYLATYHHNPHLPIY